MTAGPLPGERSADPNDGFMQSAALFPPRLLLAFSNGRLYEHVLLELVAGLCTYVLLRRLALARWASAAAGVAFALDGTFAWFSHAPVNPVASLPMLLLGIELAYAATVAGRRGGFAPMAIAGALSVYAGFPEVAYSGQSQPSPSAARPSLQLRRGRRDAPVTRRGASRPRPPTTEPQLRA